MKFELHITCSKDIDRLNIDFSDGTSVMTEKPEVPEMKGNQKTHSSITKREHGEFLDTDEEFPEGTNEVIELPNITENDEKTVKIAEELQNLNI